MRCLLLLGLLTLTGCCNVVGPFERRQAQKVDDRCISITEQERRSRDRMSLPDPDTRMAPSAEVFPLRSNP